MAWAAKVVHSQSLKNTEAISQLALSQFLQSIDRFLLPHNSSSHTTKAQYRFAFPSDFHVSNTTQCPTEVLATAASHLQQAAF